MLYLIYRVQFNASRRGKKLKSSRDQHEGTVVGSGEGGEEPAEVTSRDGDGERERAKMIDGMSKIKNKIDYTPGIVRV